VWVFFLTCLLEFTVLCTVCTVFLCCFVYVYDYSYLFCVYWCKDYCHRVTAQLQLESNSNNKYIPHGKRIIEDL